MPSRRKISKGTGSVGLSSAADLPVPMVPETDTPTAGRLDDRGFWLATTNRIARPVLENLARRELIKNMPVEQQANAGREKYSHLEAFGRLLCGLAPWLALNDLSGSEQTLQQEFRKLTQVSLDAAMALRSPDFMNFCHGHQPLVDTAFLAQGLLRALNVLWEPLEPQIKKQIIAALKSSRKIPTPDGNNWVMFAAMIEVALLELGQPTLETRLEDCLGKMLRWYVGDGAYGDGEYFHFDYYNSLVIQPMLLDVLMVLQRHDSAFAPVLNLVLQRSRRYAEILERFIAPDGTFPAMGRSVTYRFGSLQLLGQIALLHALPNRLKPAQVRCAMTAVIHKMIQAPGTFDPRGWLQIGFYGHQPAMGESYISTGSLYLCAAGLLPLGLPPEDEFWLAPAVQWTQQQIWSGKNVPADHAIKDVHCVELPALRRTKLNYRSTA